MGDYWRMLLSRLNSLLTTSDNWKKELTPEALSAGWCGSPPAPESEIVETEKRLGITLPPSYRSFLAISNGWHPFDNSIERLLPVQQIDWLRVTDPEAAAAIPECYTADEIVDEDYVDYSDDYHSTAIRPWYYPDCLLVGKPWQSEGDLILLNPKVTSPDQEWEAIFFANWLPGNERFRTFRDLIAKHIQLSEMLEASRSQ